MKKLVTTSFVAILLASSLSLAAPKRSHKRTFEGEIMDNQCAAVGSHEAMMKKEGTKDAKDCTLACVKMGGKYVLYNGTKKTIYHLDDQNKPQDFAGQKVKVTGTYDKAKHTIHVEKIEPAS